MKWGARFAVSLIWSTLNGIVRFLSRRGWMGQEDLGVPVVSVGNIQAGGAGKTPIVAYLAREGVRRGLRVCILCRGYGGAWETSGGVISPGQDVVDAEEAGDEAALLHDRVPEAWIGVGAMRSEIFKKVCQIMEGVPDFVILDDGFQHFKIKKDFEIVAITGARWGDRVFRDGRGALKAANLLVWTKGREPKPGVSQVPLVRARYQLQPAREISERIWLVTGVADPDQVRETVVNAGYQVVRHLRFPDHARYSKEWVERICREASEQQCRIALTGKDWVKWRPWVEALSQGMILLEPELSLEQDLWEKLPFFS